MSRDLIIEDLSQFAHVMGRNGDYLIQSIRLVDVKPEYTHDGQRRVYLEFKSRAKGIYLNADLVIGKEDMTRLAQTWMEYIKDLERSGGK